MTTTTRRGVRRALVGVAVAAIAAGPAMPAGATVYEHARYDDTESFSYSDCGFQVDVEAHYEGVFRIRTGKGDQDSAFLAHDRNVTTEVHTNHETGEYFTFRRNGVFNETKAVRLEGNRFAFTSVEAGQPFVVEDSDGNVVLRDRGAVRQTIIFDTGGDEVPGGTFIEVVDVRLSGPHPGFDLDLCEGITALIGP